MPFWRAYFHGALEYLRFSEMELRSQYQRQRRFRFRYAKNHRRDRFNRAFPSKFRSLHEQRDRVNSAEIHTISCPSAPWVQRTEACSGWRVECVDGVQAGEQTDGQVNHAQCLQWVDSRHKQLSCMDGRFGAPGTKSRQSGYGHLPTLS